MKKLIDLSVKEFGDILSTDSPTPGGGSLAPILISYSASLVMMAANISNKKKKNEKLIKLISELRALKNSSLLLVKKDEEVFLDLLKKYKNKDSKEFEKAVKAAIFVPVQIIKNADFIFKSAKKNMNLFSPFVKSDVNSAIHLLLSCVKISLENIEINLSLLKSKTKFKNEIKFLSLSKIEKDIIKFSESI